ncbi:metallophosphoesterase [Sphaerisporangium sp. NBC_01403]|uniref:metallophosphoesterase family protein n=1 Tax=Sphaerisporangium sp. NBC_01403 TaxID=2903599 RepID=UPI003245014A
MRRRSRSGLSSVLAAVAACALTAACGGTAADGPSQGPSDGPSSGASGRVTANGTPPGRATSEPAPRGAADPVVVAAGDISARCKTDGCGARATSDLVLRLHPTAVLALGDLQYPAGALSDFRSYYDATWGRFKDRTKPAPGNHEYITPGAEGYFRYFGAAARPEGKSYYSFDLGEWHLVSLDSMAGHGPGSAQVAWLTADLAANRRPCVLAFWHHPRFSSGKAHGGDPSVAPFWKALYKARADVVLAGHEHNYERFAPLRPDGEPAGDGIRAFVVGSGGASHYAFGPPVPGSAFRDNTDFGVLRLVLHRGGYDWRFVDTKGEALDSGTARCH